MRRVVIARSTEEAASGALVKEAKGILTKVVDARFKKGANSSKRFSILKSLEKFLRGLQDDELQALVDDKKTATAGAKNTKEAMDLLTQVVDKKFKKGEHSSKRFSILKSLKKFLSTLPQDEIDALIADKAVATASVDMALAYNMKQTKTRIPKEKIAERIEKRTAGIKKRQDRIKVLTKKKKGTQDQARLKRIDEIIGRHNERIKKNKEAIAYYKRLSNLKPVEPRAKKPAAKPSKKPVAKPAAKRPSWPAKQKKP
jgi:hypothetical protein